jgi:hypothetical protein
MSANYIVNPNSYALSVVDKLNNEAKQSGLGEYVGSLILVSVQLRNEVYLADIVDKFLDSLIIPDDWAPEPINHLTLYLSILTSLNKASLNRFQYDPSVFPFTEDEHGGYIVHRLFKRSKAEIPTAHKVFHIERQIHTRYDDNGKVIDKVIKDVKADEGIIIRLERTNGTTWETDVPRGHKRSEFAIHVEGNNDARYAPFLETVDAEFTSLRNEKYTSDQVRELILDLIRNKIQALPITRGNYFVESERFEVLDEIRRVFQELDPGINFIVFHQFKGKPGSIVNDSFNSLVKGVSDAVIKEVQDLHTELVMLDEKESKTRDSTWDDRFEKLQQFEKRVKSLEQKQLIETDIIEEIFSKCYEKIKVSRNRLAEEL